MLIVGLTGGIGSGKSFVARKLHDFGIPIYFADKEAKRLMNSSSDLKQKVKDLLGKSAYHRNGRLNRAFVGQAIFGDPKLLKAINNLVHPAVKDDFLSWTSDQKAPYVIEESAIIFENSLNPGFDCTILVVVDKEERIRRVMSRDKTTREQVLSRMKRQWSDEKKIPLADYIIDNNCTDIKDLEVQLEKLHKALLSKSKSNKRK